MKLSDIKSLGRFTDKTTGKSFNIKKGRNLQRGTDHRFFLLRGERIWISEADFFHNYTKISE